MGTERIAAAPQPEAAARPWVHNALVDVLLAWCWLPVAVMMRAAESSVSRTQALMAIVFVVSFAHQPLTLGLVYGDRRQFAAHRRFYVWAPLLAALSIMIGLRISLTVVALMAGLWNAEHTLMQRYGLIRIYGRKAGDEHGPLEKRMLVAWLLVAMFYLAAYVDMIGMVTRLGMGQTNARSVELLESLGGISRILFWCALVVGAGLTLKWLRAERSSRRSSAQRSKWIYAAATFGLVVAVVVDPIAGLAGFVAAHAIEYFAIVHSSLHRRASTGDAAPVVLVTATRRRRLVSYGLYLGAIAAVVASTATRSDGRIYGFLVLFFGALHILYDGLVWKLRTPAVAASLGITAMARPTSRVPSRAAG